MGSGVPLGRDSAFYGLPGVETPGYYQASFGRYFGRFYLDFFKGSKSRAGQN